MEKVRLLSIAPSTRSQSEKSANVQARLWQTVNDMRNNIAAYRRIDGHDDSSVDYAENNVARINKIVYNKLLGSTSQPAVTVTSMTPEIPSLASPESTPAKEKLRKFFRIHGMQSLWGTMMRRLLGGEKGVQTILNPTEPVLPISTPAKSEEKKEEEKKAAESQAKTTSKAA